MALKKCDECGKEVSDGAGKCPHCGAKISKPVGIIGWIVAIVLLAYMVQCTTRTEKAKEQAAAVESAKSPEQKAAEAKQKAEEDLRFQKTVVAATAVKQSLRDPASLQWESIDANEDASVICLSYRAKNGFGGMNLEYATFANGKHGKSAPYWNKYCTKGGLYEMKHVRLAIK